MRDEHPGTLLAQKGFESCCPSIILLDYSCLHNIAFPSLMILAQTHLSKYNRKTTEMASKSNNREIIKQIVIYQLGRIVGSH